jgi:hypothetical protein
MTPDDVDFAIDANLKADLARAGIAAPSAARAARDGTHRVDFEPPERASARRCTAPTTLPRRP